MIPTRKTNDLKTSTTGTVTTQSCNHPYLVVIVHTGYTYGAPVPSAVTYNGKAMTHIGDSSNGVRAVSFWGIVPDIGAYNYAITISTYSTIAVTFAQYQNVAQTSSYSGFNTSADVGNTFAVSVAGTLNSIGVAGGSVSGSHSITSGAGETTITNSVPGTISVFASDKPGAASISFSDTSSGGADGWAMAGVVLTPSSSGSQVMVL